MATTGASGGSHYASRGGGDDVSSYTRPVAFAPWLVQSAAS
jgi:hypothetical protein